MAITGTFAADFSNFSAAVDAAETKLKAFESDAGKVETALGRMGNALSGTKMIQDALLMAKAVEDIGGASKLTATELERLGAQAAEAIDKMTRQGREVPANLQAIADATRDAHSAWGDFVKDFNVESAIAHPVETAVSGLKALAEGLGPVGVAIVGVGGAIASVGTAIFELTEKAAEGGARLQDFSIKTGLSVPAVSTLSKAVTVAGGDLDQLGNALFMLEKNMGQMTPAFERGMQRIGISAQDFKDVGVDGYLGLIAEKLEATGDQSQRAAALQELFGRAGRELAPTLAKLNESLALTSEFKPWTAEQAKQAEEFEMQMRLLELQVKSLSLSIGKDFIGPATEMLHLFQEYKGVIGDAADSLTGGFFSGLSIGREAMRGAADIAETLGQKIKEMRGALDDVPESAHGAQSAFEQWAVYLATSGWEKLAKDAIHTVVAEVHVLASEIGDLPGVAGPATERLAASWQRMLPAMAEVHTSIDEQKAAERELIAAHEEMVKAQDKFAGAWTELNSIGTTYRDTIAGINPQLAEQASYYLRIGGSLSTVAAAFPALTAAQVKALDEQVKATEAALAKIRQLEADHTKQVETNYLGLSKVENEFTQKGFEDWAKHNKQIEGLNQELTDDYRKQVMDRATFENLKLWESADARIKAFQATGATAAQVTEYADKLYEHTATLAVEVYGTTKDALVNLTDEGINAMIRLVAEQEKAVKKAASEAKAAADEAAAAYKQIYNVGSAGKDAGLGMATDSYGNKYYIQPGQSAPYSETELYAHKAGIAIVGRAAGGPVAAGSPYLVGERGPELYVPTTSGSIVPHGAGGGTSITIQVTQPLGTPEAIARAVADAQVGLMRGQGIRLPYGT